MASFGELMLCLSAVLSAVGGGLSLAGGSKQRFYELSKGALSAAAVAGAVALSSLVFVLVSYDFSVEYVRDYADRTMSLGYLIAALWGGQDGSLMFWAILQTWFTASAAHWVGKRDIALAPIALGFLSALQVFFLLLVLFHSNPFDLLGTSADMGIGLNPLLRNPYMAFHPPTLFLGFVGFSVPLAFALAALAEGKLESDWLIHQRMWILVAWVFLSIGNVLGMVWAYEELGWGGYWGWDPVENAALMPWFTATALVHSLMAEERRKVLRRWNVVLIIITFALIVFGTFLTRSGVIESVHAFAGATTGPYFLSLIIAVILIGFGLFFLRFGKIKDNNTIRTFSREWLLNVANWLFMACAVFVWVATMMPVFSDLFTGDKITLPPSFFNHWMVPLGLTILALLGLVSVIGWGTSKLKEIGSALVYPLFFGTILGVVSLYWGGYRPELGGPMAFAPAISVGLLTLAGVAILQNLRKTIIAAQKEGRGRAVLRRKLGGQIVHASVLLMFVGFTGNAFNIEAKGSMGIGENLNIGPYNVELIGMRFDSDVEREAIFADLDVTGPDGKLGVLSPAQFTYFSHPQQPTSEVIIKTGPSEDLFLTLGAVDNQRGRAVIRAVINPLVLWIWLGGILLVLGTVVAMFPVGLFARLLEMGPEMRVYLAKPAGLTALVLLPSTAVEFLFNLPAAIATVGGALLLILLYNLAVVLGHIAVKGDSR